MKAGRAGFCVAHKSDDFDACFWVEKETGLYTYLHNTQQGLHTDEIRCAMVRFEGQGFEVRLHKTKIPALKHGSKLESKPWLWNPWNQIAAAWGLHDVGLVGQVFVCLKIKIHVPQEV